MTSPRSTYGGGYYSASFPDTPIYDSLVAERGTRRSLRSGSPPRTTRRAATCPPCRRRCPPAGGPVPARLWLPAGAAAHAAAAGAHGVHPQQAAAPRGYPGPQHQQPRPAAPGGTGYEAMRPAAPGPPAQYQDPYNNQQYRGY
ncbi:DUF6643 family protein [Streptomyces sp. F001]|uniref:DUF6643 family protein n=1 Tax=Streptomyces sp. F001 TaxID=1510026 RepID=UPI003207D16C